MNLIRKFKLSEISNVVFSQHEDNILTHIDLILFNITLYKYNDIECYIDEQDRWIFDIEDDMININEIVIMANFNAINRNTEIEFLEFLNIIVFILKKKNIIKIKNINYNVETHLYGYRNWLIDLYKLKKLGRY